MAFKSDEEVYRVGDLHLGHKLVAATRGFFKDDGQPDIPAHDNAVIQSIVDTVPHNSTLVLYGDNSNNRDWAHALNMLEGVKDQLDLNLELIIGNHDLIHPMHRFDPLVRSEFHQVFDRIDERRIEKRWERTILSSHFPTHPGDDDRHSRKKDDPWRWPHHTLESERNWFIHAHTHQATLVTPERPNHICVSWDVQRKPISDVTIRQTVLMQIGKRRLHTPAHWGELEAYRQLADGWAKGNLR